MFTNFSGEMWCNKDKVQWKTEVRGQTQRVMCKHREEESKGVELVKSYKDKKLSRNTKQERGRRKKHKRASCSSSNKG